MKRILWHFHLKLQWKNEHNVTNEKREKNNLISIFREEWTNMQKHKNAAEEGREKGGASTQPVQKTP